jgi:hypothetical protein
MHGALNTLSTFFIEFLLTKKNVTKGAVIEVKKYYNCCLFNTVIF